MTERWRKRLEDLDKASPSDEVFRRAAEGPQLPEESIPYPSSGSRVVGGVAALVVFALAISVFVVPALRMNDTAGAPGEAVLPLWPAQTLDEVEEFQADADAAGDWYELVDPSRTASRFATDVMGWEPDRVQVDEIPERVGAFLDSPVIGPQVSGITYGYGPASQSPSMGADAPFRTYSVSWRCAANERCPLRGPVTVTVFQPLERGDGKVWMVLDVQSPVIDLTVSGGMILADGDEIAAGFQLPDGGEVGFGYRVGAGESDGDCDVVDSATGTTGPVAPGVENPFDPVGAALHVDLSPAREDPSCVSPQPGYVFAAMAYEPVGADPLQGGDVSLIGLSAVPLAFAWEEEPPPTTVGPTPTPTASASAGPAEVVWTTYTDPLGWTIDVPAGWQQAEVDVRIGDRFSLMGGAFAPTDTPIPDGELAAPSEPGQMIVWVLNRDGGPFQPPENDSTFPLPCDLLTQPASQGAIFRGDGLPFQFTVAVGDAKPSEEQLGIACHMLESIRFEPWSGGEVRNGSMGLLPMADVTADVQLVEPATDLYFAMRSEAGAPVVIQLPGAPCEDRGHGGTTWTTDGSVITATCADGVSASYDADGDPVVGNPETWTEPLGRWNDIVSWDGWVLHPVKG